jgi:hypothetical protein
MQTGKELFKKFCSESGMDKWQIKTTKWYAAGMEDFADWILRKDSINPVEALSAKDVRQLAINTYGDNPYTYAQQREGFIIGYKKAMEEYANQFKQPTKEEWIRVEDCLPDLPTEEHFNWVNVSNGEDIYLSAGYWDGKDWYLYGSAQTIDTITHWMPLPTSPIK